MPAWCFDFLYLLYFLIISRSNVFNFLLNFGDSKLLPPHCLHYGLDGPLARVFISIICATHVPQTFVVATKPDEFISVVLSPLHFRSAWKSLPRGFIKTSYAKLRQKFCLQQQSWADFHCCATCICTAMVYTGRAGSLVHGRVKKLRVGEGEWASYCPFGLVYISRVSGRVKRRVRKNHTGSIYDCTVNDVITSYMHTRTISHQRYSRMMKGAHSLQ